MIKHKISLLVNTYSEQVKQFVCARCVSQQKTDAICKTAKVTSWAATSYKLAFLFPISRRPGWAKCGVEDEVFIGHFCHHPAQVSRQEWQLQSRLSADKDQVFKQPRHSCPLFSIWVSTSPTCPQHAGVALGFPPKAELFRQK